MFELSNANSKLHNPITSNKSKNPTMLTSKLFKLNTIQTPLIHPQQKNTNY